VVLLTRPVYELVTPAYRTKRAKVAPDDALPPSNGVVPLWPGRAVRVDGSVTYVRSTPATGPDAEPAVYVHGLGGSSTNWTDLAPLLASRLDAEAIDLPACGRSDPAGRYSVAASADRVIRWIEHTGRGRVHLFGSSLGGAIAVKTAASRPDLVRSLTLISPALPFLDPRRSLQARVIPLLAVPRGDRLVRWLMGRVPPEQVVRDVIAACFVDPECVAEQRFQEAIEELRARREAEHYTSAYIRTMRSLIGSYLRAYLPGDGSLWRVAATVQAPTLVIGARQDRLVDIRVAPRTAWAIPDSRLLMLDGVGHLAHMEAPRLVARAAVAFLDEVRR
jgi:pimeloyl-ACP methyl ester carboxylesterase